MTDKVNIALSKRSRGVFNLLGVLIFSAAVAAPVWAHHSYAMFDSSQDVTHIGVVKRFLWTNPHSILIVSIPNAEGELEDYYFEANGPGYLARNGWSRQSLKRGDEVTVVSHPLRDPEGSGGDLLTVTLPDGSMLFAKPGASDPASQLDQGGNQ
ncbi:MAG: hypothetical protein COA71_08525 [SAR86 cluster bacterium]|uniref:Uncharacterized protein n=1 Tax=SAR86 cluster bacterium TaxID=2030880 RepID=A0A2A5CBE7_9GAMM|nr:hypothetical protein [Gammaproteobacteria bacterium AH-315-E17]PCJ41083.1 MAG: hypothetical protein COA71_08525 [SAR86 cluster bacterium]